MKLCSCYFFCIASTVGADPRVCPLISAMRRFQKQKKTKTNIRKQLFVLVMRSLFFLCFYALLCLLEDAKRPYSVRPFCYPPFGGVGEVSAPTRSLCLAGGLKGNLGVFKQRRGEAHADATLLRGLLAVVATLCKPLAEALPELHV